MMPGLLNDKIREHKDYEKYKKDHYPVAVLLHQYGDYAVVYVDCSVKMPEPFGWYSQMDTLYIYKKGYHCIAHHSPALDPYVDVHDNIVSVTSDGKCWIYDMDKEKELLIRMPIVAFDHYIDVDDDEPGVFKISGTGCVWGCESDEIPFTLTINKETLEVIDEDYDWGDDDDDEEESEDDE